MFEFLWISISLGFLICLGVEIDNYINLKDIKDKESSK